MAKRMSAYLVVVDLAYLFVYIVGGIKVEVQHDLFFVCFANLKFNYFLNFNVVLMVNTMKIEILLKKI